MPSIDWLALLMVAGVTIGAAVAICSLMALSDWFLTPTGTAETVSSVRRVIGIALIALMGLVVLFGLYLMIPYFR